MYKPKIARKKDGAAPKARANVKKPASTQTLARACAAMTAITVMAVVFACWTWFESSQRYAVLEQGTVQAVVAQRDIAAGELIEASAVSVEAVPTGSAPANAATAADQVAGRVALNAIPARATVSSAQVSGNGASTLAGRISANKVAVTASVTAQSGGAGLVRQGDSVTLLGPGGGGDQSAHEIARGARVLACGGELDAHDASYGTLTVEVTREQAMAIATAEAAGAVTFVVEPPQDGGRL